MSPLLAALAEARLAGHDAPGDRATVARSAAPEVCRDDPPPLAPGTRVPGGARVLSLQAVCPARAFCEVRLGARDLEAPGSPLDSAMRGKIVHRLLERLYGRESCRRGLGTLDDSTLRHLFDGLVWDVLDEFLPRRDEFLFRLRTLERDRLWSLVCQLRVLDGQRGEFNVEAERPRDLTLGSLELSVRLDRIDRLPDGGHLIIDYKTGQFAAAGWKSERLADCQLPLYASSGKVRGVAVLQLRLPHAVLLGVGAPDLLIEGFQDPGKFMRAPELTWEDLLNRWRRQLTELATEFAVGDFRINPARPNDAAGQFALLTRVHDFHAVLMDEEP